VHSKGTVQLPSPGSFEPDVTSLNAVVCAYGNPTLWESSPRSATTEATIGDAALVPPTTSHPPPPLS
jgi:hypothetical protein